MGNGLNGLLNIYTETLAELDAKGYAELYKTATERLLKELKHHFFDLRERIMFNPFDIEYHDGYFIFAHGTNSVVSFRVCEAPGWLFGIWWDIKKRDDKEFLVGQVFVQYERFIDKFKPSASTLIKEIEVAVPLLTTNEKSIYCLWSLGDMIRFIIKEPALAFCRDVCYWNYNEEYHSRKEAQCKMARLIAREDARDNFKNYAAMKELEFFKSLFQEEIANGEILFDYVPNQSPAYSVVFKEGYLDEPRGYFPGVLDFDFGERDARAEYEQLTKELEERANQLDCYYFSSWCLGYYVVSQKVFHDLAIKNAELNSHLF